jgi:hypothetical protein
MAEASGRKTYNTFVKGFITEATGINFPENATIDEANFELNRDGSRQRRLGFDYENDHQLSPIVAYSPKSVAYSSYTWTSAGAENVNIGVAQAGNLLHFYRLNDTTISGGSIENFTLTKDIRGTITSTTASTIDLSDYVSLDSEGSANYQDPELTVFVCDYAIINNTLVVSHKGIDPIYIEAKSNPIDEFAVTTITIRERDFDGVTSTEGGAILADDLELRPTVLDGSHEYNLRNQGFDERVVAIDGTHNVDGLLCFQSTGAFRGAGVYPSNSDNLLVGYSQDGQDREWSFETYRDNDLTAFSESPQGHFLLDSFNKDRKNVAFKSVPTFSISGESTIGTEVEKNRPETVASYAGRVWYSGIDSEVTTTAAIDVTGSPTVVAGTNNKNKIYFTRSLTTMKRAGQCYQKNDPTAESLNDLLASDGGVISIQECGFVHKLIASGPALFVIASNGVWEISGQGDGAAFAADSFKVNKVSNVGALGRDSVVEAEGAVFYWSTGGIYAISRNEIGLSSVTNITESTIQSFYNELNSEFIPYVAGFYDDREKKIRWLYNTDDDFTEQEKFVKTGELIFDVVLKAWYKHTIGAGPNGEFPTSYVRDESINLITDDVIVVSEGHTVVVGAGNEVGYFGETKQPRTDGINRYLLVVPTNSSTQIRLTWGGYVDSSTVRPTFLDWSSTGSGVGYSSFMVTGYELFGDPAIKKQAKQALFYFNRTEDGFVAQGGDEYEAQKESSCFVRARWDWSDSGASGKWGTKWQAYRLSRHYIPTSATDSFEYGKSVVVTKNRIRGSGRALSLYIESETGKDIHLLGWTLNAQGRDVL